MPYDGDGNWIETPDTVVIPEPDPVTSSDTIDINAPDLFGGESKEGGVRGTMYVMMGESTQEPPATLVSMHGGGATPGYRGVLTAFYDGLVCCNNPYPKPWMFRVRRILQGWDRTVPFPALATLIFGNLAIDAKAHEQIKAMNAAHIIYECATNRSWGRGLDPVFVDEDAFEAAAQAMYDEGLALCLRWNRQDTLDVFVQSVLDHIGGALYISRSTGKLTLSLFRGDYDVNTIPFFTHGHGLLGVEEDTGTGSSGLVNEVVVKYRDPISNNERTVRVQNIASVQSLGGIYSTTKNYPGLPTPELALRVAQRDLKAESTPLKRFKVRLDRRGYQLVPTSVIRIQDLSRGLNNIVLRVGQIDDGSTEDGSILLTCIQDVFGMPATSFVDPQDSLYEEPSIDPEPVVNQIAIELSYRDLYRYLGPGDTAALPDPAGYAALIAQRPSTLSLSFQLFSTITGSVYDNEGIAYFAPSCTIDADIGAGWESVTVDDAFDEWAALEVNTPILIVDAGGNFEIVRLNTWDTILRTLNISRGCADTVPSYHLEGARLYFYHNRVGVDPEPYIDSDVVEMAAATTTYSGTLDVSLALMSDVTMNSRVIRPYPPGNLKINDVRYDQNEYQWLGGDDLVLTWSHRNRLTQGDVLVPHEVTTISPEAGTTYTIEIIDASDDSVVRTDTGITGETYTYTEAMWTTDGWPLDFRIRLFSVRDGYESLQSYAIPVISPYGYGYRYGDYFGGFPVP